MCIYFAQLFSISVSTISPSVEESSLNSIYFLSRTARLIPLIASLNNSDIIGLILLIVICLCDLIFFYCAWDISNSSTKEEENNYKLKNLKARIVSFYFEIYRWFLIIPKIDISVGGLFCGILNDSSIQINQNRCSEMLSFMEYKEIVAFLSILQLLSLILSCFLFITVYNSAGFMPSNPIKPRYSNKKYIEFFLIFILILFSYPQVVEYKEVILAMQHLIGVYYQLEYFLQFPLLNIEYTTIYANIINTYAFACILQTTRYFYTSFLDKNFLVYLTIISTFLMALQQSYMRFQINRIRIFDLKYSYKHPYLACLYFEELIYLAKNSFKDKRMYLVALGMLEFHQQKCQDVKCPCLKVQNYEECGYDIPLKEAKNLNTPMGVYLFNLSKNHDSILILKLRIYQISFYLELFQLTQKQYQSIIFIVFVDWIMKFVDYHIRDLIKQFEKMHIKKNLVYQDISMRFWFFCIRSQKNVIKALFSMKSNSKKFHNKTIFFKMLELATSRVIENTIKTRDKSMKYSYRSKDVEKAKQFEVFEHMVASEAIKKNIKQYLIEIMKKKQDMMQKLIEGYESFNKLFADTLYFLKEVEKLENILRSELAFRKDNIEYLRLLSILKIRLLNDTNTCKEIDVQIHEINDKDKFQDENTVNSLNILKVSIINNYILYFKGNVVSMISGFSTQIAQILAFSESSPSFFGYKKNEFETLSSLNDLIPECIAEWHDNYMIRLVETGVSKIIRRYRVAIAKDKGKLILISFPSMNLNIIKQGFLFPINIYVNYFWHINYDFCFSALILKLKTNSQFVLADPNGVIKDISYNFYKFFSELYPSKIDKNLLIGSNITLIIPQLHDIFENYDVKNSTAQKFEVNLPKKIFQIEIQQNLLLGLNQFLRDYKRKIKTSQQIQQNMKGSPQFNIQQYEKNFSKQLLRDYNWQSSQSYGKQYLQFEVTCNIKQENIQFYHGGALILYLIEIVNYTPIDPISQSSPSHYQLSKPIAIHSNHIIESQSSSYRVRTPQYESVDSKQQKEIISGSQFEQSNNYIGGRQFFTNTHSSSLPQSEQNDRKILEEPLNRNKKYLQEIQVQDMDNDMNKTENIHINNINNASQLDFFMNQQDDGIQFIDLNKLKNEKRKQSTDNDDKQKNEISQQIEKNISYNDDYIVINPFQNQSLATDIIQGNSFQILTQNFMNDTMNDTYIHFNQSTQNIQTSPKNEEKQQENKINVTQYYNQQSYPPSPSDTKLIQSSTFKKTSLFKQQYQNTNIEIQKENLINANCPIKFVNKVESKQDHNILDEQLPFEGTSHHTEEQSQRFRELSKKSGTVIILGNNQSFSDDDKYDEDQNISSSDDAHKNKEWDDDRWQINSISSASQTVIYNAVKQIHTMANQKTTPGFLVVLYGVFSTQWILFMIFSLTTYLFLQHELQDLKLILTDLQFSSSYMIPTSVLSIGGNYISFVNSQIIKAKNVNNIEFFFNQMKDSFNKTKAQIDKLNEEQLVFDYQEYLMNQEIQIKQLTSISQRQIDLNIDFLSFLYKMLDSSFDIIQNQIKIKENSSLLYMIQQNYYALDNYFDKLDEEYSNQLDETNQRIRTLNTQILLISIFMLVIFTALLIPPFKKYRQQVIQTLKTVSRITEEEAQDEIFNIKLAQCLLESENEEYLITRFGDVQKKEEESLNPFESKQTIHVKLKSSRQKKEKQKQFSSAYLNDRVKNNNMFIWLIPFIILILVMCSCVYFTVYIIMKDFLKTLSNPIEDQFDFSKSIRNFGKMTYSRNIQLLSQSISQFQITNPSYQDFYRVDMSILQKQKEDGIQVASSFLLNRFLDMSISSDQTNSFKSFLQDINNGNTCNYFDKIFFSDLDKQICLKAQQGLINIGFKNAITASINNVREFINWSDQLSLQFIQTNDYTEQLQVEIVVMKMLLNIQERLVNDNKEIIDSYTNTVVLLYIVGGSVITILFFVISIYSLLNTIANFRYLRKSIFLIPFKRLTEDTNTRFLIKKFMDSQSSYFF